MRGRLPFTVPRHYHSAILTDLDNTLYNWVDFFAPSFRAMVHVLSKETAVGEDLLIEDFRRVYAERRTIEYSFVVQELEVCRGKSVDEVRRLVRYAKGAFSRVREKNLKPYPGVKDTLLWARQNGIGIFGVTNANVMLAAKRLQQMNLAHLFDGLVGWCGPSIPENYSWTQKIKQANDEGRYDAGIPFICELDEHELKPNPAAYRILMKRFSLPSKSVYIVGDSLSKDLAPAQEVGATGIWASYGHEFKKENFQTLLRITPWNPAKVSSAYDKDAVKPNHIIDLFSELTDIVRAPQVPLLDEIAAPSLPGRVGATKGRGRIEKVAKRMPTDDVLDLSFEHAPLDTFDIRNAERNQGESRDTNSEEPMPEDEASVRARTHSKGTL